MRGVDDYDGRERANIPRMGRRRYTTKRIGD
jgi:hypothetical protein